MFPCVSWDNTSPDVEPHWPRPCSVTSKQRVLVISSHWSKFGFPPYSKKKKEVTSPLLIVVRVIVIIPFNHFINKELNTTGPRRYKWVKQVKTKLPLRPQTNPKDNRASGTWRGSVQLMKKSLPSRTTTEVWDGESTISAQTQTQTIGLVCRSWTLFITLSEWS